jgi:hypothetical protein
MCVASLLFSNITNLIPDIVLPRSMRGQGIDAARELSDDTGCSTVTPHARDVLRRMVQPVTSLIAGDVTLATLGATSDLSSDVYL